MGCASSNQSQVLQEGAYPDQEQPWVQKLSEPKNDEIIYTPGKSPSPEVQDDIKYQQPHQPPTQSPCPEVQDDIEQELASQPPTQSPSPEVQDDIEQVMAQLPEPSPPPPPPEEQPPIQKYTPKLYLRKLESAQEVVNAALHGLMDVEYPLTSKIVRIFTSSTFTGWYIKLFL